MRSRLLRFLRRRPDDFRLSELPEVRVPAARQGQEPRLSARE